MFAASKMQIALDRNRIHHAKIIDSAKPKKFLLSLLNLDALYSIKYSVLGAASISSKVFITSFGEQNWHDTPCLHVYGIWPSQETTLTHIQLLLH